jgi:hypothetical protein|tara:strand:- start:3354 stop:3869 length:516 start_codon:yes stop_codon:yes gene_type:complete
MANIKDYRYKLIKNFFSKEELELLQRYCYHKLDEQWKPDLTTDCPSFYNDALTKFFLEKKQKLVEKESGLELYKTYSYWRYYMYGSSLLMHKDRPSCEISVTACIQHSNPWPITIDGKDVYMKEGEAVIYLGCEILHGRKQLKHDSNAQVFFHYVDKNGPNTEFKDDVKMY